MSYSVSSFSMRDQNFDDDIDIFDFSKPLEPIYLPGGQTEGHVIPDDSNIVPEIEERPVRGQEYAEPYQTKELEELRRGHYDEERQKILYGHGSGLMDIEVTSAGTVPDVNELVKEEFTDVYKEYYKKRPKTAQNLLVNKRRREILASILSNEVVIITGYTGCGKSTQVPQIILDHYAEKNQHCNIAVTQPRRIAAITIAERVCHERDWPVGTLCGYQVGQKEKVSEDTRLTYMTVGVFLNQIVNAKDLTRYTHVIIDEIHERNLDTDFALLLIKKLMNTNSRNVKVILMSATIDARRFAVYFQKIAAGRFVPAPVYPVDESDKRTYLVQTHYLQELSSLGELPKVDFNNPTISEEGYNICIKLIKQFEKIDGNSKDKKAVLVFLPGINEIEELHKKLSDPKIHAPSETLKYNWLPLPLHSTITHQEQIQAFKPPPSGYRKVILATNIAESSITVPDIKYVIDFCLTKVLVTDTGSNFTSLQLSWTSKNNCEQRSGRVGRVMDGRVYRMVPKDFYDAYLEKEATPDMLRCPLEKVVLQSKQLQMGEPKAILALALDPPNLSDIERTILVLKEAGGLLLTANGSYTPHDGDLTYLGLLMAQLPLDIRLTRLIVLGYMFSVLPECIVMAASMSLKSVFSNPFKEKMLAYNSKLEWADASCSDCIAFLNVYKVYKENVDEGYFQRSAGDSEEQWARRHFIQIRQLREVVNLVADITRRLKMNQIEEGPTPTGSPITYNAIEKALILKAVIAGAFYPNYFGRGGRGGQIDEPSAVKTLGGRDPYTTIYLSNYPHDQPPHLYSELIRRELKDCREDMRITYDGSRKVYVEFRRSDYKCDSEFGYDDKIPGKISMAVYRAVKLRQIRRNFIDIRVMRPEEAQIRAGKLGINRARDMYLQDLKTEDNEDDADDVKSVTSVASSCTLRSFPSNLPGIDISALHVKITHHIDAGHFWVCHSDHQSESFQEKIFEALNTSGARLKPYTKVLELGDVCVAPWAETAEERQYLYRARIEAIYERKKNQQVKVFFIDFGNTSVMDARKLLDYTDELYWEVSKYPMQAIECVLNGLAPSVVKNKNGTWSKEANDYFKRLTADCDLYGKIFSVVNGVVSLDLFILKRNEKQESINELLLQKGFADQVEESYLSKANHEIREQQQAMDSNSRSVYNNLQSLENWNENKYDPPDRRDCKLTLELRGPVSPLEMKVFSYARGALCKDVKVAMDSVNSVLLDTDPQDPHERLIVAAYVSQNQSNTTLILHQTTMMPNIHGLAALIPFIFAPKVELRVNETKSKYIGLICGLGVDQDGKPMFPEHDMEIPFDVEFSFEDFKNVNRLRYLMSQLLYVDENEKYPSLHWNDIVELQKKIKKTALDLFYQKRKSQEIQYSRKQHVWGLVEPNCYIQNRNFLEMNKRSIFPFHPGIQIRPDTEEIAQLRNHNEELNRKAREGIETYTKIYCELCDEELASIAALRIHLNTAKHKDREVALLDEYE